MFKIIKNTSLLIVVSLVISILTPLQTIKASTTYNPLLPKTIATTSIVVLDMTKDTAIGSDLTKDLQYVYLTIQGLVNRTSSEKIYFTSYGAGYVGTGTWSHLNWTEPQAYLDDGLVPVPRTTPTLDQNATYPVLKYLLQRYSSYITGKVKIPASASINDGAKMAGLTACAFENAIPVTDFSDSVISSLGYSFTQKADTSNMTDVDAFNWSYTNYFNSQTNKKVMAYHRPSQIDGGTYVQLDYLIANKVFIYGLDLTVASNRTLAQTLVNSTNYPLGTPVMATHEAYNIVDTHFPLGYPIEITLVANYSVHSSFPSSPSIITAPPATQAAAIDSNTVYVAFMVTDGDSSRYGSAFHYDYQRNSGNHCSDARNLPIGFTMSATAFDLFPNMLKWKSQNTNSNKWEYIADSFHGDGVPGATQQAADNFINNYKNYHDSTNGLFKGVNFFYGNDRERQAAAAIGFDFFVRGYQGNETTNPDWQYNYNVPSVQIVAGTQNSTAANTIQAIRYAANTVPLGQPAFVLSTCSDGGDYIYHDDRHCPFKISNDTATDLNANHPNGRNVVYLKPSELFATWKAYKGYSTSTITVDDNDTRISYTGTWNAHSGGWHETETANSSASLTFTGTGVSIIGSKVAWGGTGDVYIDNVFKQTVSFNNSAGTDTTVFTSLGLTNGTHTIKLVAKSGWNYVDKIMYTANGEVTPSPAVLLSQGQAVTVDTEDIYDVKANAVDGNLANTYSSALTAFPHWIYVDLGATKAISQVKIYWREQATSYKIQTSNDATTWTDIYSTTIGPGGTETLNVTGTGRYVRLYATAGIYNNSMKINEYQVYGN